MKITNRGLHMHVRVYTAKVPGVLLVTIIMLTIVSLFFTRTTGAEAAASPSWMVGDPVLMDGTVHLARSGVGSLRECIWGPIYIAGISTAREKCVTSANNRSISSDLQYVKFGSDQQYYPLQGMGTGLRPSNDYSPITDYYVQKEGFGSAGNKGYLTIGSNVLGSAVSSVGGNGLREYTYSHIPDFTFSDSNGPIEVGKGGGMSNNGRWYVVEVYGKGLARIDLQNNYKTEFFSTLALDYGGIYPWMKMAVSDDGKHVAVNDIWMSFLIFEISDSCTRGVSKDAPLDMSGYVGCPFVAPQRTIWPTMTNNLSQTVIFGDSGYELFVTYSGGGWREVRAANYAPNPPRLDYLALGDSYSSGEGDTERDKQTDKKYYRPGTNVEEDAARNQPREKCHISTRSYPYILSKGMALGDPLTGPATKWQSVACSGATVYDANKKSSEMYKGQGKGSSKPWQSDGGVPRLVGYDADTMKTAALNEFIPGRQKQIKFVKRYKPSVITLTMGGNDIGFGEKISSCLTPGVCSVVGEEGEASLAKEIKGQYSNLKAFYEQLYEESGRTSKIFVLGYPQFINGVSQSQCGLNIGSLNDQERAVIQASVEYFNNVIEQAARAAGVKYIDVEDSLDGGRLCDEGQVYVTGVSLVGGSEAQESFHPSAKGNYQMAMKVWEQVGSESLLDYDICPGVDANICPDATATKESIVIPPLFQVSEPGYEIEYARDMTAGTAIKGSPIDVVRSSYSFMPDSTVEFTLFSDPIALGGFTASSDGSLSAQVQIPASVPAGYHTLVADGATYSGEPIRYEQIILVQGSSSDDIDDNGVLDSQQPCGPFLAASGIDADMDGTDDACDPYISGAPELYRWRFGSAERTYSQAPEDESQIYIERNVWAGSKTGVSGDADPDGDGWSVVGVSRDEELGGANEGSAGELIDFEVLGGGTESDPYMPILYIRPNTPECRAYRPANLGRVGSGELRTLAVASISNEKCPQQLQDNGGEQPEPPKGDAVTLLKAVLRAARAYFRVAINAALDWLRSWVVFS